MTKINFDGKKFAVINNTKNGEVNPDTVFEYQHQGDLVTATYTGGTVKYGTIVARLHNNQLDMLYQCLTEEALLKAGKAVAEITLTKENKIKLSLDWQWIAGGKGSGQSVYIEL